MHEQSNVSNMRQSYFEELKPFDVELRDQDCRSGHVAARPRKARGETSCHGVTAYGHDDWYRRSCLSSRKGPYCCMGDNDIDLQPNQLGRQLGEAAIVTVGPAGPR